MKRFIFSLVSVAVLAMVSAAYGALLPATVNIDYTGDMMTYNGPNPHLQGKEKDTSDTKLGVFPKDYHRTNGYTIVPVALDITGQLQMTIDYTRGTNQINSISFAPMSSPDWTYNQLLSMVVLGGTGFGSETVDGSFLIFESFNENFNIGNPIYNSVYTAEVLKQLFTFQNATDPTAANPGLVNSNFYVINSTGSADDWNFGSSNRFVQGWMDGMGYYTLNDGFEWKNPTHFTSGNTEEKGDGSNTLDVEWRLDNENDMLYITGYLPLYWEYREFTLEGLIPFQLALELGPPDPEEIPEPATIVMLGLGVVGLGVVAYRRRKHNA